MGLGRMLDDTVGAERAEFPMLYPALWEMKALNNKSWNDTRCKGVEKSKPVYYVQMQTYMAYLGLGDYPALFTALNKDTGEIYAELRSEERSVGRECVGPCRSRWSPHP